MNINFKQPRYIIPLIMLPFLLIFFYTWKTSFGKPRPVAKGRDSLQYNVADVSDQVKKSTLEGKLDAYRDRYRKSDGYTAIGKIDDEQKTAQATPDLYNDKEKRMLDSIDKAVSKKYGVKPAGGGRAQTADPYFQNKKPTKMSGISRSDQDIAIALNKLRDRPQRTTSPPQNANDPMQLFRQQMALIDSVGKSRDPAYQAEQQKKMLAAEQEKLQKAQPHLPVTKAAASAPIFNTVSPQQEDSFIRAIIDQDMTGYAGSRLRIRLLDDLTAGHYLIRQGTYLYALISGFSGQRVLLTVQSIMQGGHILPVKLELYDNDGIPGLYVPSSAFRDFTKDFGGGASQGMTLQQQADNNNQLVMSVVQKMFESTTTAVSKLIRQNKAKIKYNTLVYLIDPETLKHQ